MKTISLFTMLFIGINIFATDTKLNVQYENADKENRMKTLEKTAVFVDGKQVPSELLDPISIERIDSEKMDIEIKKEVGISINGKQYESQVYITLKNGYEMKPISLNALKNKHTTLPDKPIVFMINGEVIKADYDHYMVDENYLLKMVVEEVKNDKEQLDMYIINLLTKSDKNIRKANQVRIR